MEFDFNASDSEKSHEDFCYNCDPSRTSHLEANNCLAQGSSDKSREILLMPICEHERHYEYFVFFQLIETGFDRLVRLRRSLL